MHMYLVEVYIQMYIHTYQLINFWYWIYKGWVSDDTARTIVGPKFVEVCMQMKLVELYTHMYIHTYQLIDFW